MYKYEFIADKSGKLSDALYSFGLKPSQVSKLLKNKDVRIDNIKYNFDALVDEGQNITFFINENLEESAKNFNIIYEDENIVVINKPAGVEVTGSEKSIDKLMNMRAVHRLDKNTKGLLILAKNKEAEHSLLKAFKEHNIEKHYVCEVLGNSDYKGKVYEAYLKKNSKLAIVQVTKDYQPNSAKILTQFKTIKKGNKTSVVECNLLTGKTHQIRAHLAFLGNPILGDDKYGNKELNKTLKENKQKLFCYFLKFVNLSAPLEYLNQKEFFIYDKWCENILKALKKN
ncbi:MAG: RluA family pseudouridine synthase [Clostridia bacterium]|nr:RluA family pseudouridine synthase [Clostridia bacterium]